MTVPDPLAAPAGPSAEPWDDGQVASPAAPDEYVLTTPELTYAEVEDMLKHPSATVEGTHPGREEFVPQAITLLDGRAYQERKRSLLPLFAEPQMRHWEGGVLRPAIVTVFAGLEQQARLAGAPVAADLMVVLETVFWPLAAEMVGIDGVSADETALFLRETARGVKDGFAVDSWVGADRGIRMEQALAAREAFYGRYVMPSTTRRRALIKEASARGAEADLPVDAISLLLRAGCDDQVICSDATSLLVGATENNANAVAECLVNLECWFRLHPEDRHLAADEAFLHSALEETIRLRGSTRLRIRSMTSRGQLASSGRDFTDGDRLVVDFGRANREQGVFGEDASEFEPHRSERLGPRVKPYGVAFGAGRHLCLGRALALGDPRTERAGLLVPLLAALYQAGIRFDPDKDPRRAPDGKRYEAFSVTVF
jgi:cytochrome P450